MVVGYAHVISCMLPNCTGSCNVNLKNFLSVVMFSAPEDILHLVKSLYTEDNYILGPNYNEQLSS